MTVSRGIFVHLVVTVKLLYAAVVLRTVVVVIAVVVLSTVVFTVHRADVVPCGLIVLSIPLGIFLEHFFWNFTKCLQSYPNYIPSNQDLLDISSSISVRSPLK